ncbi:HAAS signaling domain-containing protein [Streptomyces sp. NPDC053474]|uniref:HAAS signaling domain-containing protein n=1 Tax=Streptomyces sp. NPDC053474 TaxID=3365704 RepID=UPI0037D92A8F
MKAPDHALVLAYLTDVERATAALDPARRAELLADLREHIEISLAEAAAPGDDATVREVLAQLGDPAAIAASALAEAPPAPDAPEPERLRTRLTILVLAASGPLMLFGGPLAMMCAVAAGVYLLSTSTRWTTRQKLKGGALTLSLPALLLVGLTLGAGRVGIMELLLLLLLNVLLPVLGARLLWRTRRHARPVPAQA